MSFITLLLLLGTPTTFASVLDAQHALRNAEPVTFSFYGSIFLTGLSSTGVIRTEYSHERNVNETRFAWVFNSSDETLTKYEKKTTPGKSVCMTATGRGSNVVLKPCNATDPRQKWLMLQTSTVAMNCRFCNEEIFSCLERHEDNSVTLEEYEGGGQQWLARTYGVYSEY